jgi:hypothetical protein
MTRIREVLHRRFSPAKPLDPGIYHYQSPPYADSQYRLHLRIEYDGEGLLIIDASTILHLNKSAAEYAFHIIQSTPLEEVPRIMANRYDISPERIQNDFNEFKERIFNLIDFPDLDPVSFFEIDRVAPYSNKISAPYRIDCALTYRLREGSVVESAPTKRVDRELTTDEWVAIINKAWKVGIPHIIFTGGEPTSREDLPVLIAQAEANGQVTGLLTDGFNLIDKEYLNTLLFTGLDHLMIILEPEEAQIWNALETILSEDIFTTVHLTLNPGIIPDIPKYLKRLADLGVNAISLSNTVPELDEELISIRDLVADLDIPLVWDIPVPYSTRNPVSLEMAEDEPPDGAGKAWLYIEPDGDVLPAQGINQVLGNLLTDEWDNIWN